MILQHWSALHVRAHVSESSTCVESPFIKVDMVAVVVLLQQLRRSLRNLGRSTGTFQDAAVRKGQLDLQRGRHGPLQDCKVAP